MKKKFPLLALTVILLMASACKKAKKNYDDYLPKVKIESAVVQTDGSVLVTGRIESEGSARLERIGLCCSTGDPKMTDRQIVCDLAGDYFSGIFMYLSIDSSYNFRGWATNKYGYSYSDLLTLTDVTPPPVTAPCTLTMNTYNTGATFGSGTYSGTTHRFNYSTTYDYYYLQANSSTQTVELILSDPVTQGTYSITNASTPGYREMNVSFSSGSYTQLGSGTVYVNSLGGGQYDLTICDAPWMLTSSTTLHFKTRMTVTN
ncbi:MAG: hypothetical protein JWO09_1586 [Bacteroidetes bacterium]|nr:hypothetical protein [Bacteroidota bacterium]